MKVSHNRLCNQEAHEHGESVNRGVSSGQKTIVNRDSLGDAIQETVLNGILLLAGLFFILLKSWHTFISVVQGGGHKASPSHYIIELDCS